VLFGLDARHQKADLIRAFLEGVAFSARDNFEAFEAHLNQKIDQVIMSGGGSKSAIWQQITADVLQKRLSVLDISDTETFGNALLAGFGTGIFSDIQQTSKELARDAMQVRPNPENEPLYSGLFHLYRRVYADLREDFRSLGRIGEIDQATISHFGGS
jgi:xylulokinase